jgi:hypothetical protein
VDAVVLSEFDECVDRRVGARARAFDPLVADRDEREHAGYLRVGRGGDIEEEFLGLPRSDQVVASTRRTYLIAFAGR